MVLAVTDFTGKGHPTSQCRWDDFVSEHGLDDQLAFAYISFH